MKRLCVISYCLAMFIMPCAFAIEDAAQDDFSSRTVPQLVELFSNESALVRWVAAAAFEKQGDDAIPVLVETLTHKDPLKRQGAAAALGYMGGRAVLTLPHLIQQLKKDDDWHVRRASVNTIGYIAAALQDKLPDLNGVISELIKALSDKNYNVRDSAAKALGNLGPNAVKAIRPLGKALKDKEWWVRESAAKSLRKIDPSRKVVGPMLEKALKTETQRWVIRATGKRITGVDLPIDEDTGRWGE